MLRSGAVVLPREQPADQRAEESVAALDDQRRDERGEHLRAGGRLHSLDERRAEQEQAELHRHRGAHTHEQHKPRGRQPEETLASPKVSNHRQRDAVGHRLHIDGHEVVRGRVESACAARGCKVGALGRGRLLTSERVGGGGAA